MDDLEAIHIPRSLPKPPPDEGPRFKFSNLRQALNGGVLQGLYRDLRANWKSLKHTGSDSIPPKTYEILTYKRAPRSTGMVPKPSEPQILENKRPWYRHHHNPVSSRLKDYDEAYLRDSVRELVAEYNYDYVFVTYVWMSKLVDFLLDQPRRPTVVCDTIDVQYIREMRLDNFRQSDSPYDCESEKRLELEYLERYDLILAITKVDELELKKELQHKDIITLPIEASIFSEGEGSRSWESDEERRKYDLVFLGADNEANAYTVEILLKDIMPELLAKRPGLRIGIGGQICNNEVVKAFGGHSSVDARGYIHSIEDFYREGRILAAPIPAGGGVKVKILEAMAHGLPVVTTELGVEGIDFQNGRHGYVVSDNESFVNRTLYLLDFPEERRAFSKAARQHLQNTMGAKSVYSEFDEYFNHLEKRSYDQ